MRRLWGNRRTGRSPDTHGPDSNAATSRPQFGRGPTTKPLINSDNEVNSPMSHKPVIIVGAAQLDWPLPLEGIEPYRTPKPVIRRQVPKTGPGNGWSYD